MQWLLHVIEQFGTVNGVFTMRVFDEGVFDNALALVGETVGEMSWRGVLGDDEGTLRGRPMIENLSTVVPSTTSRP